MKNIKIKKIESVILSGSFGDQKYYGYNNQKKIISLVKIKTDSGHYSYGESLAGIYSPEIFKKNLKVLSLEFKNKKIFDGLKLCKDLQKNKFFLYQGILKNILASIEMGLLHLISKIKKKSFSSTVNLIYFKNRFKENNYVDIYASTGSILSSNKELLKDIITAKKLSIDNIKVRLKTTNFKEKLNILEKNSKNFSIDLIANTYEKNRNQNNLKKFLSALKTKKPLWLEEVVNVNDLENFNNLKKNFKYLYSYGENFNSYYDFINLIKFYKFDYVNLDISHCTITDLCSIINFMHKNKLKKKIIFHCWGGVINLHTSLELGALLNKFVYMVEFPTTNFTLNNNFIKNSNIYDSKYYFDTNRKNINDFYDKYYKKKKNFKQSIFRFD